MPLLLSSLAVLAALTLLELRWPVDRTPATRGLNLGVWALSVALGILFHPLAAAATVFATNALGGGLVDLATWPLWAGALVFTLAMDLGEYLFHRAQHALPWLWRLHSLHHSDPNMNASTAQRHYWADPLIKAATIWLAVGLIFKATPAILAIYGALGVYNYFSHANLAVNFGRWSWALNSPAYHRIHHSSLPADYDTNFAALLPIFDVIAGSYRRPRHVPATGLPQAPRTAGDVVLWPLRYDAGQAHPDVARPGAEPSPDA